MATDELQQVLSRYDVGELRSAHRVEQGYVNENWAVETGRGCYFLKRRHPDLRNPVVIAAQHALIAHLRQAGFPAPTILSTIDGDTLLVFGDEFYEIQEYIEGTPYNHANPAHFREAARTLGCYHRCVVGCAPQALRGLGGLYSPAIVRANLTNLAGVWGLDGESAPAEIVRRLEAHAADLAACFAEHGPLPELVIHGDYYAGNLLFVGDRVSGVVDYDKACWQPRVVEVAEALIYFASPRPGHLKHLVYPGFLEWEPFVRFLGHYARVVTLDENEARALPDYIRCIWLSISPQRLLEKGSRTAEASEALREVLALGDWAAANAQRMTELVYTITKERK